MTGKLLVGSVVGPTTLTHWGQVLHLPNAYGVVEVSFPDGGARAAGIHLLSELSSRLADTPRSLHELTDIVKDAAGEGTETILLCVPVGRVLYVALHGKGDVYLRRGRQFARLLHDTGSISGEIQPDDTIILASGEFSRALTAEEAVAVFDHLTPSEVAEKLTLILHEKPYGDGSAAMVLQFTEVGAEAVEEKPAGLGRLARTKVFLAHFHPRRVRRHMSISVLKNDFQRLQRHPKRMTVYITAALILLFTAAVALGIWKQVSDRPSAAVVSAVSDARHALDEGVALMSLNPVKGRERLQTAKDLLDPLPKTREIQDLLTQVNDNLTQSMQISKVSPELFFDAALVKKNGSIAAIGLEGTTMGILDTVTGTVISLDVTSKKATVVGGGSAFSGMSEVSIHGDALYVLTSTGIQKVNLTDNNKQQQAVNKDPQWKTITAMVSFGGNLYLLDTGTSRVWKYVATETGPAAQAGFTDTREYLNPDTLPDLSQANSMAIDGSVWMGSANGKLWKFTGGKEDTFIPQGVAPDFGNNLIMYTDDAINNLYILDVNNKRVVVLDKDGTYLAQYAWTDTLIPTALAVSEEQKKIYLLASGKLYTITLK